MTEPYDTGRHPLNTALDRLRTIVLRGDTTKVALLAAALEILKASDRGVPMVVRRGLDAVKK